MLVGGGFLLITGLYPALPEPIEFCASADACTTSFVATWHQRCVFLGGALLFSGVIGRLFLALVAGERPAFWCGAELPALLGLVYLGSRSLFTFTEATNRNASWLPRLKVGIRPTRLSPRRPWAFKVPGGPFRPGFVLFFTRRPAFYSRAGRLGPRALASSVFPRAGRF
jgi:hypothetical protein